MRQSVKISLFLLLIITLAFLSCKDSHKNANPPLLEIRGEPKGKVDLFQKRNLLVTSSSSGSGKLFQGKRVIKNFTFQEGDAQISFRQSKSPQVYRLFFKNKEGLIQKSPLWRTRYPTLEMGSRGKKVMLLHRKLHHLGYKNAPLGKEWTDYTTLAVLAFRKSNNIGFEPKASPRVLRMLLKNKGAFRPREKRSGKYVEVDLTRQVMALIRNGKAQYTYHISSGASATPSDLGRYTFYSKVPGYNSIGMYYSIFYNRGEATHGYESVPNYPASHGCIRNPIPSSLQIYNWIPLGSSIWVY